MGVNADGTPVAADEVLTDAQIQNLAIGAGGVGVGAIGYSALRGGGSDAPQYATDPRLQGLYA